MNTGRHDEFDRAVRALHSDAVAQLSPQVRHRLRAARTQAFTGPARPRFAWPAAGALAAAVVLAVALPLRSPTPGTATPATASIQTPPPAPQSAAFADTTAPTAIVALEESPDFYLWLASNDAGRNGLLP